MKSYEAVDLPSRAEQRLDVAARLVLMLGLFALFVVAGLAMGAAAAIWQRSWAPIPTGAAIGLGAGAVALLAMAFHDWLQALEVWSGRDIDGNGSIGDLPADTEAEPGDLAHRVDRALAYITEQGGLWSRRKLCDELGLFSQSEWAAFYGELTARGILDGEGKKLLAVSYRQAREMWDKDRPKSFTVLPGARLVRK